MRAAARMLAPESTRAAAVAATTTAGADARRRVTRAVGPFRSCRSCWCSRCSSAAELLPLVGDRAAEHLGRALLVEDDELEAAGEGGLARLLERDVDVVEALQIARDARAADDLDADADRLGEARFERGGERELPAQADDGPGRQLVGERRDEPAVHDAERALVQRARREPREHLVAILFEREPEPVGVIRPASEARLPRPEDVAIDVATLHGGGAYQQREAGSRTTNSLPRPGPSLCAETEPPWRSTRLRTIVNPTPRPPSERSTE